MIIHKLTLMIAAILGLFTQVLMAQSPTTLVPTTITDFPVGTEGDVTSALDFDDEDFDEEFDEDLNGDGYVVEYFDDIAEWYNNRDKDDGNVYLEDPDMAMYGRKPAKEGVRRKKPKGVKSWDGKCGSDHLCTKKYYPQNCPCNRPKKKCSCATPIY